MIFKINLKIVLLFQINEYVLNKQKFMHTRFNTVIRIYELIKLKKLCIFFDYLIFLFANILDRRIISETKILRLIYIILIKSKHIII
jgi:hypothetical protein